MTFRRQVGWCLRWDLAAALSCAALTLAVQSVWTPSLSESFWDRAAGFVLSGLFVFAFLSLVFGVVLRSAHRWMWLNAAKPSTLFDGYPRRAVLENVFAPFWWWWLHIDRDGGDRDAYD